MKKLAILVSVAVVISGCATAPQGTPGTGVGDTYTPIVDMAGVDAVKYDTDLRECRQYAAQVSPGTNALGGAIAGALLVGLLSAAMGGNSRYNGYAAAGGAIAGGAGAGAQGLEKQQDIIKKCLTGRGYNVLG